MPESLNERDPYAPTDRDPRARGAGAAVRLALLALALEAGVSMAMPCCDRGPLADGSSPAMTDAERGQLCTPTTFDAHGVDLHSWLCIAEFQAFPSDASVAAGNDIWGYVSPSGREYALMGMDGGTGIVEITDPENPEIIEVVGHAGAASVWSDIKTYGERAYVVTDGQGGGLQIIDLSSVDEGDVPPATIYTGPILNRFTTAHNIAIDEDSGIAYIIAYQGSGPGGQGFMMLDLENDPTAPPIAGQWHSRAVHDLQAVTYDEGPYAGRQIVFAAASGSGFAVLDVTDAINGNIETLAIDLTYPGLSYCHQCWVSEDLQFCFVNDELDEGGPKSQTTTTVFDISDLDNITYFGQFTSGRASTDHNLMVRGSFVYEANYRSGLQIFDISNMSSPASIRHVAYFDTHPGSDAAGFQGAWSVFTDFPSGSVIVSDIQRGLFVLDPVAAVAPSFQDVTTEPVDDPAVSRGVAWGDVDADGDPDLYVANENAADRLFRNDEGVFVDILPDGLRGATASQGAAWGDMENDGDPDLYVTRDGAPNVLLRNDGGVLVDVTAPPLNDPADSRTVSWVDVNLDGHLDLFIANRNDESRVFINDGGTFSDTWSLGPRSTRGMGAAWTDYDGDGDPDLALARVREPNMLFTNEGDGAFTETVVDGNVSAGVSVGVAWGDVDRDGDPDVFFANAGTDFTGGEPSTLLRNDDGAFVDVTEAFGVGGPRRALGVGWADADQDGWIDLLLSDTLDGLSLYRNGEGTHLTSASTANFLGAGLVYGFGIADIDGDGGADLYAANASGPNHLYGHLGPADNHWIAVELEGGVTNPSGIGAEVSVWADGVEQRAHVQPGAGYLSQHEPVARFGLGTRSAVDSIVVRWPVSRRRGVISAPGVDQMVRLSELDATPIGDGPEPLPPGVTPGATRLYAAAPNPFNPRTRIVYDLARPASVTLSVFDAGGRHVRALVPGVDRAKGRYTVFWDGRDEGGRSMASGTYFYRLLADRTDEVRRLTLLR